MKNPDLMLTKPEIIERLKRDIGVTDAPKQGRPIRTIEGRPIVEKLLDLLSNNRTVKEACYELNINTKTAKDHLWRERQRTGTQTIYNLVAYHVRRQYEKTSAT
jgi:DNA-binding CsgD family transcriptional regulator